MIFVYPILLGGLLLAGVPVLLHFLIRRKPKTLLFPAFRFLMQKRRTNTRNLRLRHLLLLLLRMLLIILVCLALARPRLLYDQIDMLPREKPVAMVLVFDTSPSMGYKFGEVTRLEVAKKTCLDLLDQLSEDSRVLILDTADSASFARADWLKSLATARQRIQSLTIRPDSASVTIALDEAHRRFEEWDRTGDDPLGASFPRFVCFFSDRTRASWSSAAKAKRDPVEKVRMWYFDVGIDDPVDLAITQVELPGNRQSFTAGETISLRVVVQAAGKKTTNAIFVQIGTKKTEQAFNVEAGKAQSLTLDIDTTGLEPGFHHAEVKLETESNQDALSFNDVRYVAFEIHKPQKVLVLADDPKNAETFARALKSLLYTVDVHSVQDKEERALASYSAVFLDGVSAPTKKLWESLEAYVQQGGGVGIVPPGDELDRAAYNSDAAKKVMPAVVIQKISAAADQGVVWKLKPDDFDRPFLFRYRAWFAGDYDITMNPRSAFQFWEVAPLKRSDTAVLVEYDDKRPAIVERQSLGKVILLTTPMDEQKPAWNNYYTNLHSFYPGLTLLCARHLCPEPASRTLNYQFGSPAPLVERGLDIAFPKYLLSSGDFSEEIRFDEKGRWVGERLAREGNYTISGTHPDKQETKGIHGFSINVAGEESDLGRVPIGEIEAVLGKETLVPQDRNGSVLEALSWDEPMELFPWLMIALLLFLALENLMANRFYRQEPTTETL